MTDVVDYRPRIMLSQGGCSARFLLCHYNGKERQFLHIVDGGKDIVGHMTERNQVDNETLGLTISNFYENWKVYLVPAHLSYHKVTEQELIQCNGGREVYLNAS